MTFTGIHILLIYLVSAHTDTSVFSIQRYLESFLSIIGRFILLSGNSARE